MKTRLPHLSLRRPLPAALVVAAGLALALPLFEPLAGPSLAGDGDNRCVVTFGLQSAVTVTNVQWDADYVVGDGEFDGVGQNVICAQAVGGALAAWRDHDGDDPPRRFLTGIVIRVSPFDGPLDLVACRWLSGQAPPTAGDFFITVTDAGRPADDDPLETVTLNPLPKVVVSSIECPGTLPGGLTTTTTTSTTLFGTSTTLVLGEGVCGFPTGDLGDRPSTTDALFTLNAAVQLRSCDVCVCDVDGSGKVEASDALQILRVAVELSDELDCPVCG